MKRMAPLAEENKILQEVLSLSEKSIQRAQRERDLAESNSRDLEHQNGVLSKRLTASSEQLKKTSEELAIVSEELKKMSEQLMKKNGELDSKIEQLDQKCQQLEDVSKLKSGIHFHIMCFAVSGRIFSLFLIFCACKARCRTQPASPERRTNPTGENEGIGASQQTGRRIER